MSRFQRELVRVEIIEPPGLEPISIAELRQEIRQTSDYQDDMLLRQISGARMHYEKILDNAYLTQKILGRISRFYRRIGLPRPPLQSVESIQYYDVAGNQQILDSSVYGVEPSSNPGYIYLKQNQHWPQTQRDNPSAVEILYFAGYGDTRNDVPQDIRQAILMLCATIYTNPGLTGTDNDSKTMQNIHNAFLSEYRNF